MLKSHDSSSGGPGFIFSTHMVAPNCHQSLLQRIQYLFWPVKDCMHVVHAGKTPTYLKEINREKRDQPMDIRIETAIRVTFAGMNQEVHEEFPRERGGG